MTLDGEWEGFESILDNLSSSKAALHCEETNIIPFPQHIFHRALAHSKEHHHD